MSVNFESKTSFETKTTKSFIDFCPKDQKWVKKKNGATLLYIAVQWDSPWSKNLLYSVQRSHSLSEV